MNERACSVITVGVDGSADSRAALAWAAAEAQAKEYSLRAVVAWLPAAAGIGMNARPLSAGAVDYGHGAQQALEEAVEQELGPAHSADCEAVRGNPLRVLAGEGSRAVLLVIGAHGGGRFRGLPLGSVSERLVRRAPCPVVVVPAVRGSGPRRSAGKHLAKVRKTAASKISRRSTT